MVDPRPLRRRSVVVLLAASVATITLAGVTPAQGPGSPIEADVEPQSGSDVDPQSGSESDKTPCVLLRNDQVVFGTAEQQGDWVVVRNGQGNHVRLQRSQVACWANSPRDLFQYRLDHRRPGDPAVHVRDARWCLRYRLLDLAAEELRALRRIVPAHPEATIIESQLRSALANSRPRARPDPEVATVGFEEDVASEEKTEPPDDLHGGVSGESFHEFVRTVQPLLINRCGGCHTHTSDLDWQLVVLSRHRRPTARITRENLTATLEIVRPGNPDGSELLDLATSPHAGGPPPLSAGDESSIEAIRDWIRNAHPASRHPASLGSASVGPSESARGLPPTGGAIEMAAGRVDGAATANRLVPGVSPAAFNAPDVTTPDRPADTPGADPKRPSRLPAVQNPFDPALFNRRYHRPSG